MLEKTSFTVLPDAIKYMRLPDKELADVWMRENITEEIDTETGETVYTADEAYFRTSATKDEIADDFDGFFDIAAAWDYRDTGAADTPSDAARIAEIAERVAKSVREIIDESVEAAIDEYTLELIEEGVL